MRLDANGNPPTMERAAVVTGMDLPHRLSDTATA